MLILQDRTINPSDIEMRMESQFDWLQSGKSVACKYADSANTKSSKWGVAYMAELHSKNRDRLELQTYSLQIAAKISMEFRVETKLVVFTDPGLMPQTTSGKKHRLLCKQKLLDNTLSEVFRWSPFHFDSSEPKGLPPFVFKGAQSSQGDDLRSRDELTTSVSEDRPQEACPPEHLEQDDMFSICSPSMGKKVSTNVQTIIEPSFDFDRRYNFEVGTASTYASYPPHDQYTTIKSPLPPLSEQTQLSAENLCLPVIVESDSCSPLRKAHKSYPTSSSNTELDLDEIPIMESKLQKKSRLRIQNSSVLSQDITQDDLRRKSAPPHPLSVMRLKDELRRYSVNERKVSLKRKEQRNTLQTLTATIGRVLGTEIDFNSNIWAHGCNSVKAVQLSQTLQKDFGFSVESHLLLTHQTPVSIMNSLQRSLLDIPSLPPPKQTSASTMGGFHGLYQEQRKSSGFVTVDDGESSSGSNSSLLHRNSPEVSLVGPEVASDGTDIAVVGMACSFAG